jgi:Polyketide cyclase / dehydrase and lipid transport
MLSLLGILLLVIVFIILILPLFIKKNYSIEKQITIHAPNSRVYDYVKLMGNQVYYNKWVMMDPQVKRTASGTDGELGYTYAWDSLMKNVGKGEQEITQLIPGSRIHSIVRFEKPFKNTADVEMITSAAGSDQTLLTWKMSSANKYPMNIMNLFVPAMLRKDMSESLGNLKKVLEK